MTEFDERNDLPSAFMEVEACDIQRVFPKPTLVTLDGERRPALFVSILLHGNENAGLMAMQEFLRRYRDRKLPRSLILFVGNVDACRLMVRFAHDQVDFNRAWPGSDLPRSSIHDMLATIYKRVVKQPLFASIDIHNNTGRNPLYSCICSLAPPHVQLASLFSQRAIYFTRPKGVQTQAFMAHCPAITLECGMIGDVDGAYAAADFLQRCSVTDDIGQAAQHKPIDVFHTVACIRVRAGCSIGFHAGQQVVLREDLDLLNFLPLEAGESLGMIHARPEECFLVLDEHGNDVTSDYLETTSQNVILRRPCLPAMLTRNLKVMRQDCLGYLMEKLSH